MDMESVEIPARPPVQFRDIPETAIDRALSLAYLVFHESPEDEKRKHHHDVLLGCTRVGAYDGDELVGFLAAHPFTVSVPGGDLPCPGVTFVSVAPTHRRRGVLTGLMTEYFARAAAEGTPIASLWASEDAIYGRFGFGSATHGHTVEIDSRRPLALRIAPDERPLRLLDPACAPEVLGPYYERTRADRAGRLVRTEAWWREEWMATDDEEDDELSPPRVVVIDATPASAPTGAAPASIAGYALYRTRTRDDAPGLVRVDDLQADTPAAEAALWRYLASIDLTGLVRAWGRPVDDPLLLFAADRDQVRVTGGFPALWLRLLDVRAALTARSWAAPVDAVMDVRDDRIPANAGRHRLTASPASSSYERTEDPADLTLDVRDLAACYLGGTTVTALIRAGLAREHTPGTAAALDTALRTALLPHTVDEF
ncbi:GNAT family N-acetyltransferase OS=Streptomyces alboniger OX=132473 GN=CP975_16015 PE=3 SV=1 [Streptomyces alboniger]